ncbi:MAG TPA: hypothetical protein VHY37_01385 [Tepidisphaeraceae bacterium]|jgi:hypothetical protein|nr:hypothetical protein [Tepidisphaeraceae bacterium]
MKLFACWMIGLSLGCIAPIIGTGCATGPKSAAASPIPVAKITGISFTGPGLDGVPTMTLVDGKDVLIAPPEYMPATHRNEPGFMVIGTRFHVRVSVSVSGNGPAATSVSATCPGHPELDLPQQPLVRDAADSHLYRAVLQIPAPLTQICLYDSIAWKWTIHCGDAACIDRSTNTIGVSAGPGDDVTQP